MANKVNAAPGFPFITSTTPDQAGISNWAKNLITRLTQELSLHASRLNLAVMSDGSEPITGSITFNANITVKALVFLGEYTTAGLPSAASNKGAIAFDKTLNRFVYSNGTAWVYAAGMANSITAVLKGDGSGNAVAATAGTDFMSPSVTSTLTVGYTTTPFNLGTVTSGTVTPSAANGNYQYGTINGSFTIAAPSTDSGIDILWTNGGSAVAPTFSGFTVGANTGDLYATTNGNKYILSIRRINGTATYIWKALQ